MNTFEKPKISLEERVVRDLEEDIIFGRLKPGAPIREEALLERFGGTRHFVRQALARLEKAGMVIHERNRGAMVRSFSTEEVSHIYEVREMVNRQVALRIPLPASQELIGQLELINEEYGECINKANLRDAHEKNDRFHRVMFSACTNPYLSNLAFEYMDITLVIRAKNLADPGLLRKSFEQHRLMIKYLRGSDNWLLAELCVDHIQPSKLQYLEDCEE
jgi:DNA-binding GntR family transcriptional regulator